MGKSSKGVTDDNVNLKQRKRLQLHMSPASVTGNGKKNIVTGELEVM